MKADVYSFGVMLWEMVSGEVPYDGMELQEVCGSICRGNHPVSRPDFNARLPGICALMERCWELRPSARPDCGQLLDELADIQDVLDLRSVPSPPPLPPPPIPLAMMPREQTGSPEQKRSSASAMGFSVTREDLEAQRLRLRRPPDEHEAEVEATSASLLSHVMKRAIRERRTDSGWGQQVRLWLFLFLGRLNLVRKSSHRTRAMPEILGAASASHLGPSVRKPMIMMSQMTHPLANK